MASRASYSVLSRTSFWSHILLQWIWYLQWTKEIQVEFDLVHESRCSHVFTQPCDGSKTRFPESFLRSLSPCAFHGVPGPSATETQTRPSPCLLGTSMDLSTHQPPRPRLDHHHVSWGPVWIVLPQNVGGALVPLPTMASETVSNGTRGIGSW